MIIYNGKNKSIVCFGKVTIKEIHTLVEQVYLSHQKWVNEGCPKSGDFA